VILFCAGDPYDVGSIDTTCPIPPFASEALEPLLSREALEAHYAQHQAYCRNTRRIVREYDPELQRETLLSIVRHASLHRDYGGPDDLFSQAGQAWNHAFLWLSLRARRPGASRLATTSDFKETALGSRAAKSGFSSFSDLCGELTERAINTFGSQWAWLVYVDDALDIVVTTDAESPITRPNVTPLLVVDLWEHAYFLDYRFDRPRYAKACVERLLDWDRADAIMTLELCDR